MPADTLAGCALLKGVALLHVMREPNRLDLQAEEQKEFAQFMTPVQRAKYSALQDQLRRRMQDLVRARPDSLPE